MDHVAAVSCAPPVGARLLIRLTVPRVLPAGRGWASMCRRLLSWLLGRARAKAQPLLAVQIDDSRGRNVLALEDSGSLIDVPLPPGIYQVTASLGAATRSYTMALEAGTPVELHVQLPADPG